MNRKIIYKNGAGKERVLDFDKIREWASAGRRIELIKEYRQITNKGLKDSTDAVEYAMHKNGVDAVEELFREALGINDPYTKEEFLHLIEDAIDNMEHMWYDDMLEATIATLDNIKKQGGLEFLARKRSKFLNSI